MVMKWSLTKLILNFKDAMQVLEVIAKTTQCTTISLKI
jgi:hypothetical protein